MRKVNKKYGYPYNIDNLTPVHIFKKDNCPEFRFYYKSGSMGKYIMQELRQDHKQCVVVDGSNLTNIMCMLDNNGWKEVRV